LYRLIWGSENWAANIRGCDRGCAKLDSRSSCSDERFLGRCCGLVPWSWIIVRVFKAKGGGYPKVNGPTEFFPGDAPLQSTHSQKSKITASGAMILGAHRRRGLAKAHHKAAQNKKKSRNEMHG